MTKGFRPAFTIGNRITAWLTRIERAWGVLEAAALSESSVREMRRRALLVEAHHTTHVDIPHRGQTKNLRHDLRQAHDTRV
jgi:hypothetical protein